MSLGLGVTLLLTLALVGTNFQREIAKSIPDIAPDYFFVGIQKGESCLLYTSPSPRDLAVSRMPSSA